MKTYSYANGAVVIAFALSACNNGGAPAVPPTPVATQVDAAVSGMAPEVVSVESFGPPISDVPKGGNCSLDAIQGAPVPGSAVSVGQEVLFGGWMADGNGQVPSDALLVFSSTAGSYAAPVTGGGSRPDVAQALSQEGLATSGYDIRVKMDVPSGNYELFIVQGGDSPISCALGSVSVQ